MLVFRSVVIAGGVIVRLGLAVLVAVLIREATSIAVSFRVAAGGVAVIIAFGMVAVVA